MKVYILGCIKDLVNMEWLRNLLLLTNLLPSHTIFMSIYSYLWITINTSHLSYIYYLTYPYYSMRVNDLVISMHICQYLLPPHRSSLCKNINNDIWYTPGWNATLVYYLCAWGLLNILFSQLHVTWINTKTFLASSLGMTT